MSIHNFSKRINTLITEQVILHKKHFESYISKVCNEIQHAEKFERVLFYFFYFLVFVPIKKYLTYLKKNMLNINVQKSRFGKHF